MFTPKKIHKAFEKLFEMFDEDDLAALIDNYLEEIEGISPYWLAKAFNANATKLYGYRAVSHIEDGMNFYGKPLTKKKGVLFRAVAAGGYVLRPCPVLRYADQG